MWKLNFMINVTHKHTTQSDNACDETHNYQYNALSHRKKSVHSQEN